MKTKCFLLKKIVISFYCYEKLQMIIGQMKIWGPHFSEAKKLLQYPPAPQKQACWTPLDGKEKRPEAQVLAGPRLGSDL